MRVRFLCHSSHIGYNGRMERKVIRASVLGFCMGVRRAVDIARKSLVDFKDTAVYTYGPLIHNEKALENLEKSGLRCLYTEEELEEVKKNAVESKKPPVIIIRAHGIPPEKRLSIEKSGCIVVDATCPRVLANQKKAASYAADGYTVIVAGDRNHGEVAALAGCVKFSGAQCILVADRNDAENVVVPCAGDAASGGAGTDATRAVLIGQTTISRSEYDAVAAVLRRKIPDLVVLDTICPATMERQKALTELCGSVDGVIVIGGKNSANTRRLYMTAQEKCAHAVHIEAASEIPPEFFSLKTVGIAAGASTPDNIIDEVESSLNKGNA